MPTLHTQPLREDFETDGDKRSRMKCKQYDECGRDAYAKGMCLMHYKRQWRKTDSGQEATQRDYAKQVNNPERLAVKRAAMSAWSKANRQKCNAIDRKRRMTLRDAYHSPTSDLEEALCAFLMPRCMKCGGMDRLELDHVVPVSKGGRHEYENFQTLCKRCNSGKKDRDGDYRLLTRLRKVVTGVE